MKRFVVIAAFLPVLGGCDALKDRMGIPDPARIEAEGRAVGGACRHAGRGIEDCYQLNPKADKPSVFMGWKEMNEYMIKNNMQAMTPEIPLPVAAPPVEKGGKDGHGPDAKEGAAAEVKDAEAKDAGAKDAKAEPKAEPKADAKAEDHAKPAGH